jgi:hypothetical protein
VQIKSRTAASMVDDAGQRNPQTVVRFASLLLARAGGFSRHATDAHAALRAGAFVSLQRAAASSCLCRLSVRRRAVARSAADPCTQSRARQRALLVSGRGREAAQASRPAGAQSRTT